MQKIYDEQSRALELRHANRRMLTRYAHWPDYMLTVTFGKLHTNAMPNEEQVCDQLRHMQCTLNTKVWHNRTRFNQKCKILFIPIVEGARTETRIHAHILLGHVQSRELVEEYITNYIPKSRWLRPTYDLQDVHDADGIAWYLSKETAGKNVDAVLWQIASIPSPLIP